jgi:hypothetical protein
MAYTYFKVIFESDWNIHDRDAAVKNGILRGKKGVWTLRAWLVAVGSRDGNDTDKIQQRDELELGCSCCVNRPLALPHWDSDGGSCPTDVSKAREIQQRS